MPRDFKYLQYMGAGWAAMVGTSVAYSLTVHKHLLFSQRMIHARLYAQVRGSYSRPLPIHRLSLAYPVRGMGRCANVALCARAGCDDWGSGADGRHGGERSLRAINDGSTGSTIGTPCSWLADAGRSN
eukprot:SAG31_NODE_3486_length_4210_cov_1.754074_2_plen_128_part_00